MSLERDHLCHVPHLRKMYLLCMIDANILRILPGKELLSRKNFSQERTSLKKELLSRKTFSLGKNSSLGKTSPDIFQSSDVFLTQVKWGMYSGDKNGEYQMRHIKTCFGTFETSFKICSQTQTSHGKWLRTFKAPPTS